jgi:hypothetical protein
VRAGEDASPITHQATRARTPQLAAGDCPRFSAGDYAVLLQRDSANRTGADRINNDQPGRQAAQAGRFTAVGWRLRGMCPNAIRRNRTGADRFNNERSMQAVRLPAGDCAASCPMRLCGIVRGSIASTIEIVVTIAESALRAGASEPVDAAEMGDVFVPPETARRLCCDAGVVEVVESANGEVVSVGRKRRTFTGSLKRALLKRDRSCTFPGCTHKLFLECHHIQHWADGGETSLENASLLCSYHHRFVHEYGYTIELGDDHRPRFRDPRGNLVHAAPGCSTAEDLGWPRIRAANAALAIDADTIACEWDGSPVDYGAIVGHLVTAEGLS